MPTISIFLRKADVDVWKSIENKSEWMHERLIDHVGTPKKIINPKDIQTVVGGIDFCKHAYAKGLCKYGCS